MFDKARNLMLINDRDLRHIVFWSLAWYDYIPIYISVIYLTVKNLKHAPSNKIEWYKKPILFVAVFFGVFYFLIRGLNKSYRKKLSIYSFKELLENEY